jgi:hypothetical protein
VKACASQTSVKAGETLNVHVSTDPVNIGTAVVR